MIGAAGAWTKLGRILAPDSGRAWMATYTGPSFAAPDADAAALRVYVTGRDAANRSRIGVATLAVDGDQPVVRDLSAEPVFDLGDLGAFDENGVSYPWIVRSGDTEYMYYVGWMPTVLTPFQNHIGLAQRSGGEPWRRASRAPILERTDEEYLSLGSVAVLVENGLWRMWYTCFRRWAHSAEEPKHVYVIKYAESRDGRTWNRPNVVCIDRADAGEYSIGRPSVLRRDGVYHMWFSHRGDRYRIGYAWSADGIVWERRDDLAGITVSTAGWDGESICYGHVFEWQSRLYMLYCGNHYGRDGLGLARWDGRAS
jgi:hypothetical protein